MIWYEKLFLKAEFCNNMWSGFHDLILIPVQFNSIRPPGSRSGLVLKRYVTACSRPSDCEDRANRYKQKKKTWLPLCLRLFSRSPISRQKQVLELSEAETDQYCRFMSVMFSMNRQKFDERDQRYSNMHACNLVTDGLEQATWCYNWTPYPAHPPRLRGTSPAERDESYFEWRKSKNNVYSFTCSGSNILLCSSSSFITGISAPLPFRTNTTGIAILPAKAQTDRNNFNSKKNCVVDTLVK